MPKKTLEISFSDLQDITQIEILDFYGVEDEKDLNYDTQPVFVLEREEDEPEDN